MEDNHTENVKQVLTEVRKKYKIRKRPFNVSDFHRICKAEKVKVFIRTEPLSMVSLGIYYRLRGFRFIILNANLGKKFLEVALHELGHHFLHQDLLVRNSLYKVIKSESAIEKEANLFAKLALKGGLGK